MNRKFLHVYTLALCIYFAPLINAQPAPCTSKVGSGIVACVEKQYPAKLVANISLAERTTNMQFLRDRVIETARCAGLDVGLNLKRGGPSISNDFIAWKNGKVLEGVDIAGSYDDVKKPLKLMWHRYDAPNYGHPFFKAYGPVSCVIDPTPTPTPTPTPVPDADVAELRARLVDLEKHFAALVDVVNQNAVALQQVVDEFNNEQQNRKKVDDEHNRLLDVLNSRQIPDGCKVQFLSCRLTFNAPVVE